MELTLEMLLPLAAILIGARLAGQVSLKLGLPAVFGELLLGFLIGPAALNWFHTSETVGLLANIGVILLMFMAGMETDLQSVKSVGKPSFFAALGGVVIPLAGGTWLGHIFGMAFDKALFLGAVLTATSVSISAQSLREMGKLRSPEGSTVISAAIIDDVLGVLIFAGVMSLTSGGNILLTFIKMGLFFPVAWVLGDKILPWIIRWEQKISHREASLGILLALIFVYAWAAEELGSVATITGAYILGVLVARHVDHDHIVHSGISAIGYGLFIPVFFVNIGLQASLAGLATAPLLTMTLILFAVLSKIIGSGVGARLGGLFPGQAFQVGCAMVSRGEVALVIAGAGLAGGLLDSTTFSTLIVVTLATTLITPPLLRLAVLANSPANSPARPFFSRLTIWRWTADKVTASKEKFEKIGLSEEIS